MSTFLGIGLGPIQTGIFLSGAKKGGFDRIVVAEVDSALVASVRAAGAITVNVAENDGIRQERINGVEAFNPTDAKDLEQLKAIAAEACEISTALPNVAFFKKIAPWLAEGFSMNPRQSRFIYTAENDNFAAEKLADALGCVHPETHVLNTVVGKMSKRCGVDEGPTGVQLAPLCPDVAAAHLVEAFDAILISSAPGVEGRKVAGLHVKQNLLPFEEAKLYGHNAIHFMLAWLALGRGLSHMDGLLRHPDIINYAREAFLCESGEALCRKWKGADELFTKDGFRDYADGLLARMTNKFLCDSAARVARDLERKLGYDDRILGTIKLCLEQNVTPEKFLRLAVDCLSHTPSKAA